MQKLLYAKKGAITDQITGLVVGVGVATLVLIFVGVLGGQTYQQTEATIDAISNTTIRGYVKDGAANGFLALSKVGSYLPLIVLAIKREVA